MRKPIFILTITIFNSWCGAINILDTGNFSLKIAAAASHKYFHVQLDAIPF
jgi:hypothetical protein